MSNEEIMREVQVEFEIDRSMRTQNFFETIYPTLTEKAKHLLRGEYEKHNGNVTKLQGEVK